MYETHQEKRKRVYVDSLKAINNQLKQDLAIHKKAVKVAGDEYAALNIHPAEKCETCTGKGECRDINILSQCWQDHFIQQAREQEEPKP